jgi:hypothetical protein
MRPAGLTAVCIIGIVLAVFGGLGLLMSCGGMIMQPFIQDAVVQFQRGLPGSPPQMQQQIELQAALQRDVLAVQARWRPWIITGMVLQLATVALLLIGCIRGLGLKRGAYRWLVAAMLCGVVQSIVQTGVFWGTQQETAAIMSRSMAQIMRGTPGAPMPPGMPQMMSGMMNFSTTITIMVFAAWGLAKIGYFVFGACYVLTRRIRALFTPDEPTTAIPLVGQPPGPASAPG